VPALEAGFVSWDDVPMLVAETGYRGLGPRPLGWMLTSTVMGHWSPLAWLSFSVDYTMGGLDPRVFHATSLGLHAVNAALVCVVARRLLALAWREPPGDDGGGRATAVDAGALGAALLFALHPLRAETVAWISDRRDLLCATFVLLAVWAYLRGIAAAGRLRGGWRLASLAAFAAALASKGIAVTVPALLLLLDWYPLRRGSDGWRALVREKAPYAGLALVGYALWIHPARLAWPAGLSPLYELPAEMSWRDPRFLTPALAALVVTSGLLALRHRWPAGISAWAVSLILLGPVSGVVLAGRHVAADRYTYLSGLGLTLLAAGGLVAVLSARTVATRAAGAALAVLLLATLGTLAWRQTGFWHDSERLWRRAVAVDPNCAACLNNLARALMRSDPGRPPGAVGRVEAEILLRRAIRLRPEQPGPYRNLGALLVMGERWGEAETVFAEVVRRWPTSADGPAGLAAAREGVGDPAGAVILLRQAVALEPGYVAAQVALTRLERTLDGEASAAGVPR
jgi:Flp pilus assembly protein TadD